MKSDDFPRCIDPNWPSDGQQLLRWPELCAARRRWRAKGDGAAYLELRARLRQVIPSLPCGLGSFFLCSLWDELTEASRAAVERELVPDARALFLQDLRGAVDTQLRCGMFGDALADQTRLTQALGEPSPADLPACKEQAAALVRLAFLTELAGEPGPCLAAYRRAQRALAPLCLQDPDDPELWHLLAYVHLALGELPGDGRPAAQHLELACRAWRAALEKAGDVSLYRSLLGRAVDSLEQPRPAWPRGLFTGPDGVKAGRIDPRILAGDDLNDPFPAVF